MRSPDNPTPQAGLGRDVVTPPLAVIALSRASYGHRPGDLNAFAALGETDQERLAAWVAQQIEPDNIDDSACDARIAAGVFTTYQKSPAALWLENFRADDWPDVVRPGYEAIALKAVRAMHSKRQLKEVMVDFWHNHFSIYWNDEPSWSMLMQYDRDCIRPNSLGNFRTMLGAVTKSPSMMYYLDQVYSSVDGPNENFARELLELHTLGSENYFGTMASADVPGYPNPVGYVEEDVFAVTKALTGWSVRAQWWDPAAGDTGEFYTRDDWHDTSAKQLLGQPLAAGQLALAEGEAVLDILAAHPGTARFVSRKLCRRLVADFPPQSLVDSTAQVFLDNVAAPNQLALVVQHILLSAEFAQTWGQKVKRPFEIAMAALRATGCDYTFQSVQDDDDFTDSFNWYFRFTGHFPHEWHPPNGYPDFGPVWQSTSSLVMRWRLLTWIPNARQSDGTHLVSVFEETNATGLKSPNEIVDYWIERIYGYPISSNTRQTIVAFLAQGRNPAYDLPLTLPIDWTAEPLDYDQINLWERVSAAVGLMLVSPEYQLK